MSKDISNVEMPEQFVKIMNDFLTDILNTFPEYKDNLSESGSWSVGSNMSIADLALWRNMGWLVSGTIEGIPKNVLHELQKIKSICSLVDQHPEVVEWMSRTYPKNYPRGSFE